MLAHEVVGSGPPLLLVHGTMSSRGVWAPVLEALARERRVILVDLPGMGDSPPLHGADLPADWVGALGELLDHVGAPRPGVAGHSMGGWTALELAKAGRAAGVLALAPAGLWDRSPRAATRSLRAARWMAQLTPPALGSRALRSRAVRRVALRDQSTHPERVRPDWAAAAAADARRASGFATHFRAARAARFTGGAQIDVPVHVAFAGADRIATPEHAQQTGELPPGARVESWAGCGHMVTWDAPERVIAAALEVPTG